MIKHAVIFKLVHKSGSPEEKKFFERAWKLAKIPGVRNFECMEQVNPKNEYRFGITMEFDSEEQYHYYSMHAIHTAFIQECWINSVSDFLEIDYKPLPV